MPPAGDLARNPGMCPDWELNWQPFGSQASTQSTELYNQRKIIIFKRENISFTAKTETTQLKTSHYIQVSVFTDPFFQTSREQIRYLMYFFFG